MQDGTGFRPGETIFRPGAASPSNAAPAPLLVVPQALR